VTYAVWSNLFGPVLHYSYQWVVFYSVIFCTYPRKQCNIGPIVTTAH